MGDRFAMPSIYSEAYQSFLGSLVAARRRAGLTQAQVAQALGKPQSFVSKCESGERRVDIVEAAAFARVYGCAVSTFLNRTV